jgi:hypothetical protein
VYDDFSGAADGAPPRRDRRGAVAHLRPQAANTGSIMPSLTISVPHTLGAEEATTRLKNFFAKLKERYQDKMSNLEEQWSGNKLDYSFSTFGFNIKGDLNVEPGEVKVNGSLPFAAMMFKGKIEQSVREELEKLLA